MANTYRMSPVEYLCEPHLPKATVVLLAGLGGEGKSFLMADTIGRLTTGRACFGQATPTVGPINVLVLACEDDRESVLIPRLVAAGADVDRVGIIEGTKDEQGRSLPFDLSHVDLLREHILERRADGFDYRLVVIDPIATVVGRAGVDDHRDAQLKPALEKLSALAQDLDITVVCLAHLNKGANKSATQRVLGGSAYVTSSRLAYIYGTDPSDPDRRVLVCPKANVPVPPPSVAVRIASLARGEAMRLLEPLTGHLDEGRRSKLAEQLYRLSYEDAGGMTASDILDKPQVREAVGHIKQAVEWLAERLKDGPAGSELVAMQGNAAIGKPWPSPNLPPAERRKQIMGQIKWWRESVLKAHLGGHSARLGGSNGTWFFCLANSQWPPSEQAIIAARDTEADATETTLAESSV